MMAANQRIEAALEQGREDGRAGRVRAEGDGRKRSRRIAIGDPQAPFERFLTILDHHQALGSDGRLVEDVFLVSMGDHFDWGGPTAREAAAESALSLIGWLAAHPADQVAMILGNHDLARIGELARYDDASFAIAVAAADRVYSAGKTDEAAEKAFLREHPDLPTAECAARDFANFREKQRALVIECIAARRLRIAHAVARDFLLVHAGVTSDELGVLGLPGEAHADAHAVAAALNGALDEAFAAWDRASPFAMRGLHRPGNAGDGEARGMFFHRPSNPAHENTALFAGPPRRRFDPRLIPPGLTQAIGHIRDNKCRRLLAEWADGAAPDDGPLRILETDGRTVSYRHGTEVRMAGAARILFTDNGMSWAEPARYELLDLDTRKASRRLAPT